MSLRQNKKVLVIRCGLLGDTERNISNRTSCRAFQKSS